MQEFPNPQVYAQKLPKPTEGEHTRVHQPLFPILDWIQVQEIIDEGLAKSSIKTKWVHLVDSESEVRLLIGWF